MNSRVTPSSLPTREIRSSWIRIAILSGSRTRRASVSFVFAFFAFASEDAPTLMSTITDAARNAETFLNILSPHNWQNPPVKISNFVLMLGSALGCVYERKGWQGRAKPSQHDWTIYPRLGQYRERKG